MIVDYPPGATVYEWTSDNGKVVIVSALAHLKDIFGLGGSVCFGKLRTNLNEDFVSLTEPQKQEKVNVHQAPTLPAWYKPAKPAWYKLNG